MGSGSVSEKCESAIEKNDSVTLARSLLRMFLPSEVS